MAQLKDESFGIIPLQQRGDVWSVFLIQHQAGHWAFPKGHADPGETSVQAAERELKEESGLEISYYVDAPPSIEYYSFIHQRDTIDKKVTYFPAVVEGTVQLQLEEVTAYEWVSLLEAGAYVSFAQARQICEALLDYLTPEILATPLRQPRLDLLKD